MLLNQEINELQEGVRSMKEEDLIRSVAKRKVHSEGYRWSIISASRDKFSSSMLSSHSLNSTSTDKWSTLL